MMMIVQYLKIIKSDNFSDSFRGIVTLKDLFLIVKCDTWMLHKIVNTLFRNNLTILNPAILWKFVGQLCQQLR